METVVGLALLGFFAFTGYKGEFNTQIYAQMLVSGLGGGYLLISGNLEKIKELFTMFWNKKEDKPSISNDPVSIEQDKSVRDFQCLNYLRDRCIEVNSPEALDMIVQINTILFKSGVK